jgi:cytochrome c553
LGGQNANYLAQQIKSILAGERTTELAKLMVKSSPPLTQEDIEKISQYLESVKKADSFQNM